MIDKKKLYYCFDQYLIAKMLGKSWNKVHDFSGEQRYHAYRVCLERLGKERIAATQTIKKWFGLDGAKRPNREGLFQLGFALGFSAKEQSEMLVEGALEPDFQVNDYREMIFLYGLTNQKTYRDCLAWIDEFEQHFPREFTLNQHNHTNDMWKEYERNCDLPEADFLEWMLARAEDFKGYSRTVLDYFKTIKTEILIEIQADAARRLDELLAETNFERWESRRHSSKKNRRRTIPRYLKSSYCDKYDNLSHELKMTIHELLQICKMSVDSNTELLAELYTNLHNKLRVDNKRRTRGQIQLMDDKYLSDLLNVGIQKERLMRLIVQKRESSEEKEKEIYQQKRRCILIGRQDILPLILCVSQNRYARKLEQEKYDWQEAKKEFVYLANHVLTSCQMVRFDEDKYELDYLLGSCFQRDEMYSLADVLEDYFKKKGPEG